MLKAVPFESESLLITPVDSIELYVVGYVALSFHKLVYIGSPNEPCGW